MKIGICGPVYMPLLTKYLSADSVIDIKGTGGAPVNHQIVALVDRGYEVFVYSITPELAEDETREWHGENLHVYIGCFRKRARQRCPDFFLMERNFIKNAIIKTQPDIVHAHWQYEFGWAAIDSGTPTLLTCHDAPLQVLKSQTDLYRLFRLIMAGITLKRARFLTAVSPYTAKGVQLFTRQAITVIPNFEPESVFALYKKLRKMGGKPNITMINNGFHKRKNVAKGIEAFVGFSNFTPDAELHLYGSDNGIGEDAESWCKKNGIKANIRFHGEVPFTELMKALSDADVFLHTSLEESCPMVLIEAMAMGIPVVAGESAGGIPWMLENGGGQLVDVTDSDKIAMELLCLKRPEYYRQVSDMARKVATAVFSTEAVIDQYLAAYKNVLKLSA